MSQQNYIFTNMLSFGHQELSKAQRDLARVKKELTELAATLEKLNAELKVRRLILSSWCTV
jgi:hypothetical protein